MSPLAKPDTACPGCGHSPLADHDERCPHCGVWVRELPRYHAARADRHVDAEAAMADAFEGTRIGGPDLITSSAEAHPGSSAMVLLLLGAFAGLAGLGIVPDPGPASTDLGLAAVDVILAVLLYSYPSFSRPLVVLMAPLHAALWVYLERLDPFAPAGLAVEAAPLMLLMASTGEPGPKRRGVAVAVAAFLLLFSATIRMASAGGFGGGAVLRAPRAGVRLQLPAGFHATSPDALEPYFHLPALDAEMTHLAFVGPGGAGGMLGMAPVGRYEPRKLAKAFYEALHEGEATPPEAVNVELYGFGRRPQVTYEVPVLQARRASITAVGLADGRSAVLIVSAPSSVPALIEQVRQEIAHGIAFTTPQRGD